MELEGGVCRVYLDGEDVTERIRDPVVARRVGDFADVPLVRRALVHRQRQLGASGGVVADGRDVGAVIFPDADLKIHMTADLEERTRRRHAELVARGVKVTAAEVKIDIEKRDLQDQERDYGAELDRREVVLLDTTGLTWRRRSNASFPWPESAVADGRAFFQQNSCQIGTCSRF